MSVRNLHWYDSNEGRPYPLDDRATAATTDGRRLRDNLIVDLNLRYPMSLGDFPFVASVTVTPTLVTVTLQCAMDPEDATTFAPLASFAAPRSDVEPLRHYQLLPQSEGVGGWVVFGPGIDEPFSCRLAGPAAGLLAPRAARPYRPLPVASLAKLYDDTPLLDVVGLAGEEPVEVVAEQREVEGVLRDVAVVRLVQPISTTAAIDLTATDNVFARFTGPCGARPESDNCNGGEPIEFINAVRPDCDGRITIELRGCATLGLVEGDNAVVIDCGLGLSDACVRDKLPDAAGRLRNEYVDACVGSETVSESLPPTSPAEPGGPGNYYSTVSESLHSTPGITRLPYSETFDDGTPGQFQVVAGSFAVVAGGTEDGPNDPGALAPADGALLAFDADLALASGDGTPVTAWGGGTVVGSPVLHAADLNGHATVAFDGASYVTVPGTTTSLRTLIAVIRVDDAGRFNYAFGVRDADCFLRTGNGDGRWRGLPGFGNGGDWPQANAFPGTGTVRVNGVAATDLFSYGQWHVLTAVAPKAFTTSEVFGNTEWSFGGDGEFGGARALVGRVAQLRAYGTLTTAQIARTERYLAHRYGITAVPGSTVTRGYYTTETPRGRSQRNLALWKVHDLTTANRRYSFDLKIVSSGARNNGGIILNWRPAPDFTNRYVYHLVQLDYDSQSFGVWYFNGSQLQPTSAFVQLPAVLFDTWYRVRVTVTPATGTQVQVVAELATAADNATVATLTLTTGKYYPDVGRVGFHADRAFARFGYLTAEEA